MVAYGHETVLLAEAVEALMTDPSGCYVDCTYGRGGHTRALLGQLDQNARLLVVDKDPVAIAHATAELSADPRVLIEQGSFAMIAPLTQRLGLSGKVSGMLLDLGVSSPQLDDPARGFSFTQDGPLDMRMNPQQGMSVAQWLAVADEQEIAQVLKDFGEERFAKRMAKALVKERALAPIDTTQRLSQIITEANPAWEKHKHPATRAFQAFRIFINSELSDLTALLQSSLQVLAVGGRMVVISFHSLEDRMVKQFIRAQERGPQLPRHLPVREEQIVRPMKAVGKAVKASEAEVRANPRARSAIMRVVERVA